MNKKLIQKKQEVEQNCKSILEVSPDTVFILGEEGIIQDFVLKNLPLPFWSEDIHPNSPSSHIFPDFIDRKIKQAIHKIETSGKDQYFEFCIPQVNEISEYIYEGRLHSYNQHKYLLEFRDISDWKRSSNALKLYTSRLEILREIERAMLSAQTPTTIAQGVINRLSKLVPFDIACIFNFDMQKDSCNLLAYSSKSKLNSTEELPSIICETFLNYIPRLSCGKIYSVRDFCDMDALNPLEEYFSKFNMHTMLILPLLTQDNLVGFFCTVSRIAKVYNNTHIEILQEVSDSMSIAIHQARLLETERLQRKQAESLRETTFLLSSTLDIDEIFNILLDKMKVVIPFDQARVMMLSETELITVAERIICSDHSHQIQDDWIAARIFSEINQQKGAVIQNSAATHNKRQIKSGGHLTNGQNWLGVPLMQQNHVIGQIIFLSELMPYSCEEAALALSFANQASLVIEKADLFRQTQRRAEEAETLRQATATITSTLDLNQLLENILAQLERVIPYNFAYLILVIGDQLKVVAERNNTGTNSMVGYVTSAENTIFIEMKRKKKAILISDVKQDSRFIEWRKEDKMVRSWLGVPLIRRGEVFGQLSLHSWKDGIYQESDIELAQAFANQASSAIENAQLLDLLEKRVADRTHELSALYNLSTLSSETTEIDLILVKSLNLTLDSITQTTGSIHLFDPVEKKLKLAAHENLSIDIQQRLQKIPPTIGLAGCVYQQKKRVVSNDIRSDARSLFYQCPDIPQLACVCSPLIVRDDFVGILCIYAESLKLFSVDDLTLLDAISDQIALAIENAQLREQAQLAAVVEERHRLARDLHDSVSQTIYSQALFSDLGIKLLEMGKYDQLLRTLQDLKISAYQSLKEMRLLLYELQPTALEKMGIIEAIKLRLEAVERRAGIETKIQVDGNVILPKNLEKEIHHITIEALNNSLKHACASHIHIKFSTDGNHLDIQITDDGTGFNPDLVARGGLGLDSMRQRAKQIGATLNICTLPAVGTTVNIQIDL